MNSKAARFRSSFPRVVQVLECRKLMTAVPPASLVSLDGINGFRLIGIDANDRAGSSVSGIGDVNGDGFDDVLIGAQTADPRGRFDRGESYVVFGRAEFSPSLDLQSLNGANGFRIDGASTSRRTGYSVSGAGDINGDGIDDILIGALGGGDDAQGESYVVFGKSAPFSPSLDLATIDGTNGFRLLGVDRFDSAGSAVSNAGDVNGDGLGDIIIGALGADRGGRLSVGESYVVFGKADGYGSVVDLQNLDGQTGFKVSGISAFDFTGLSVSGAGDVNADGISDLIVGAYGANPNGVPNGGSSYLVYGTKNGFPAEIRASDLSGTNGIRFDGNLAGGVAGQSVSDAGDVNGDGFADLIIGAPTVSASPDGRAYVVFGSQSAVGGRIDLGSINGNGIRIDGFVHPFARLHPSGEAVSAAGDINADGFDDVIIGAAQGLAARGETYVVFGSDAAPPVLSLDSLASSAGFRIEGGQFFRAGSAVSDAGDVNGDGFADFAIGAYENNSAFVLFGGNFNNGPESQVGDRENNLLSATGGSAKDILVGGEGADTLISDGGGDILYGGAGDDVLTIPDSEFSSTRRVAGGNGLDTLKITGSGQTLDLTAIRDNRITDIEQIDLSGSGANRLVLDFQEVVNLSSHSNTVVVLHDADDTVEIGSGWSSTGFDVIDGRLFSVLTQGAATIKLSPIMSFVLDPSTGQLTVPSLSGQVTLTVDTQGQEVIFNGESTGVPVGDVEHLLVIGSADPDMINLEGIRSGTFPSLKTPIRIETHGGDDTIVGSGITDNVLAGPGNDFIQANEGSNTVFGEAGDDTIHGGPDADELHGGSGNDNLLGLSGNDLLRGGPGNDIILGSSGADILLGEEGNDHLNGQGGSGDILTGGAGADTLIGGIGIDRIVERFSVASEVQLSNSQLNADSILDVVRDVEQARLTGGDGGISIDTRSFDGDVSLTGGSGSDALTSGGGDDVLMGFAGNDVLSAGPGDDFLLGAAGRDVLDGGPGNDLLRGQGSSGDRLTGGPGADSIHGGSGADRLVEQFPNSQIIRLTDTSLHVDDEADELSEVESAEVRGGDAGVTIDSRSFSGAVVLFGGAGNDHLFSGSNHDRLFGLAGNDILDAGAGNDLLLGAGGRDTLQGGMGNDNIRGQGSSGDSLIGGPGIDRLDGGPGSDFIVAGDGDNVAFDTGDVFISELAAVFTDPDDWIDRA